MKIIFIRLNIINVQKKVINGTILMLKFLKKIVYKYKRRIMLLNFILHNTELFIVRINYLH